MSSTPRPTTSSAPYGGFALTRVRRAGGDETVRFEAVLTRDGQPVAHVSNGGEGGCHRYDVLDAGGWAAIQVFEAYAASWNADGEFAGIEDPDQLVNRLLEVGKMNRMRSTPFVLDGADPWVDDVLTIRGATPAQTIEALRGPDFAGRHPRIWSRESGDFVPLT